MLKEARTCVHEITGQLVEQTGYLVRKHPRVGGSLRRLALIAVLMGGPAGTFVGSAGPTEAAGCPAPQVSTFPLDRSTPAVISAGDSLVHLEVWDSTDRVGKQLDGRTLPVQTILDRGNTTVELDRSAAGAAWKFDSACSLDQVVSLMDAHIARTKTKFIELGDLFKAGVLRQRVSETTKAAAPETDNCANAQEVAFEANPQRSEVIINAGDSLVHWEMFDTKGRDPQLGKGPVSSVTDRGKVSILVDAFVSFRARIFPPGCRLEDFVKQLTGHQKRTNQPYVPLGELIQRGWVSQKP